MATTFLANRAKASTDGDGSGSSDDGSKEGDPVLDPGPGSGGVTIEDYEWTEALDIFNISISIANPYKPDYEVCEPIENNIEVCLKSIGGIEIRKPCPGKPEAVMIPYTVNIFENEVLTVDYNVWIGVTQQGCVWISEDGGACQKLGCPDWPDSGTPINRAQMTDVLDDLIDDILDTMTDWDDDLAAVVAAAAGVKIANAVRAGASASAYFAVEERNNRWVS